MNYLETITGTDGDDILFGPDGPLPPFDLNNKILIDGGGGNDTISLSFVTTNTIDGGRFDNAGVDIWFDQGLVKGTVRTGGTLSVEYHGSHERSRASVADSIAVDTYYDGTEIFGSRGRKEAVIIGSTGAATGTGTDTLVGRATLSVTHESTIYSGGGGHYKLSGCAYDRMNRK